MHNNSALSPIFLLNACYVPQYNSINFPAAILMKKTELIF